jgi:hypothetical protein
VSWVARVGADGHGDRLAFERAHEMAVARIAGIAIRIWSSRLTTSAVTSSSAADEPAVTITRSGETSTP